MTCFTLLVLSLFIGAVVADTCHPGWHFYEGSCYGFGDDTVTWGEAQTICISFGATLAEIGDATENSYLQSMATTRAAGYYWLGGTDFFHEGDWEWTSTRETIFPFTDWAPGQPDPASAGQDCLCMTKADGYMWHDGDCESQYDFICEASPLEPVVG